MTETQNKTAKKPTIDAWKKSKRHYVVLASGFEVGIEIPNLPAMIKAGQVPNDLLDAAVNALARQEVTADLIKEQSDFWHLLVATMVKEPELTLEDVPDLPFEDIELLVELGTRQRDIDALGRHIAGLHKSSEWRKFRGLDYGDEDVEGL